MKIYTKTGDKGTTSLYGGKRVPKSDARIEAIGTVDELNAFLGLIVSPATCHNCSDNDHSLGLSSCEHDSEIELEIRSLLLRIQNELFTLGADLATPVDVSAKLKILRVDSSKISKLESEIDTWSVEQPELRNFILPGGSHLAAQLHLARAICRRAEIAVVKLAQTESKLNANVLKYLNRLSDWLFVIARKANLGCGVVEQPWQQE